MADEGELSLPKGGLTTETRIKRNADLAEKFNTAISSPNHETFITNGSNKDVKRIITEAAEALVHMPANKRGLALGSGSHTSVWRSRGWQTLDINPRYEPDYVWDAKRFAQKFPNSSLDLVLAEHLVGPDISLEELLDQTDTAIRPGGKLILQTSLRVPNPTIPKEFQTPGPFWAERWAAFLASPAYQRPDLHLLQRRQQDFMQGIVRHAYTTVADLYQMVDIQSGETVQPVVYYAEKVGKQ